MGGPVCRRLNLTQMYSSRADKGARSATGGTCAVWKCVCGTEMGLRRQRVEGQSWSARARFRMKAGAGNLHEGFGKRRLDTSSRYRLMHW